VRQRRPRRRGRAGRQAPITKAAFNHWIVVANDSEQAVTGGTDGAAAAGAAELHRLHRRRRKSAADSRDTSRS
jgi:hypothetical protein